MKRKAYVYMDVVGNVCFQIGAFHIEYTASNELTEIKGVLEYTKTGYVVIDTNYGEEFYDFEHTLKEMGLSERYNIKEIMSSIDAWEVKNKIVCNTSDNESKIVINNIELSVISRAGRDDVKIIRAINLDNTDHVAHFKFDKHSNQFIQISSTFPDWKRKYKLLCIVNRNIEPLKVLLKT